ncbi:unnamed protein product [Rotaria sp. Silwood1]|nr:unnamed protein product [Rotaria sp. Silwood1]CAF1359309.1 unnamed protein product [Rotaria sp. Silwood1]CAF3495583.1 unnamed protein product [Rotaria sp. Silwood1]CAF3530865.1 unnamed protein product [Rotaria sp. Silwood1]CAF3538095.1 unnamed protein product [Rotaria sp. Silwood1]
MASISPDVGYLRQQYNTGMINSNRLIIQYHKPFHDGTVLTQGETQFQPMVHINFQVDPQQPYFTLIMVDPDAPQRGNERAGPWLHWIHTGFVGNDLSKGRTLADYQGPAPPPGTGPHQYIFLLYKSAIPPPQYGGSISASDSGQRKQFHLRKVEHDLQLRLIAATSYTVIG